MHGPDRFKVLVHYGFKRSTALDDIPLQTPHDSQIGVSIDEYFDVHQVTQLRVRQYQDSFNDYCSPGFDGQGFFIASMVGEVI